jgi:hypothetical protein
MRRGVKPDLLDSFERKHMIDEFEVKADDAIAANSLAANDRNDAYIMPFALDAKKRTRLDIE